MIGILGFAEVVGRVTNSLVVIREDHEPVPHDVERHDSFLRGREGSVQSSIHMALVGLTWEDQSDPSSWLPITPGLGVAATYSPSLHGRQEIRRQLSVLRFLVHLPT